MQMGYSALHNSTTQHTRYAAENQKHSSTNLNRDQYFIPYFNQQNAPIKNNKTHFILAANPHMFRHQGALFRGFIKIRMVSPAYTSGARPLIVIK
jgi:hypothetical protein